MNATLLFNHNLWDVLNMNVSFLLYTSHYFYLKNILGKLLTEIAHGK